MNRRSIFFRHIAQTSATPLAIEVKQARGSRIIDVDGKSYIDLISGISVSSIGHAQPKVVRAIKKQVDAYMHTLVYGEMIQSPQTDLARSLCETLPPSLDSVYFTNSGAEAVEGALKLAKRATGRTNIVSFNNSYHGSTHGALSVMGDEYWRNAFRPLLPGVTHASFNSEEALGMIDQHTACVIVEPIQAENGVRRATNEWFQQLREKCTATGALLILDEIQTGFGRTGTFWAFEQFRIVPDILLSGKALGGGMPLGAFIAAKPLMQTLMSNPVLGHITTFGGHPVCCAAGLAALKYIHDNEVVRKVKKREKLFREFLVHRNIIELRTCGLLIGLELRDDVTCRKLVDHCLKNGVLTDWFLFAPHCLRIAPPLNISSADIASGCRVILEGLNDIGNN
jgi:acetylornithine/N-succinyldiaminopimelate aminotransferase